MTDSEQIIQNSINSLKQAKRLANGFVLDKISYGEIIKVMDAYVSIGKPEYREPMCKGYLVGYERGTVVQQILQRANQK